MRTLVFILLLLAAAKVGTQYYLTSSAKDDAIIAAYRDRATTACRDVARARHLDPKSVATGPGDVRVVIGKTSLQVALWQVDNTLWQARYKTPYLVFTIRNSPHPAVCEFDIAQGAAALVRM